MGHQNPACAYLEELKCFLDEAEEGEGAVACTLADHAPSGAPGAIFGPAASSCRAGGYF